MDSKVSGVTSATPMMAAREAARAKCCLCMNLAARLVARVVLLRWIVGQERVWTFDRSASSSKRSRYHRSRRALTPAFTPEEDALRLYGPRTKVGNNKRAS
jgi:hypothetical protein